MSTHEQETFKQTYDWVKTWRDLPWSHEDPTLFLPEICSSRSPGRALDIGCGAGTDSVYLAQQGWDVTSLDFMEKALEYTEQRASEAGVSVTAVQADITEWNPPHQFDLVLDHGLLHNMDPVRYQAYREVLLKSLAPAADFVLLHWHPLFPGQGNGKMGPTRKSREDIKAFFAPELQERFFAREEFEDLPSIVGQGMTQAYYLFRQNQAESSPQLLIEQIEATLTRHKVDIGSMLAESGVAEIDDELLARIVGPGRLGISSVVPLPAEAEKMLAAWADRSGLDVDRTARLVAGFASEKHGNVCLADAKCNECDVVFCKRLRYR